MKETKTVNYTGNTFVGMLTILFIGLKLTGYITWSWWWVLSPIWISLLLFVTIFLVTFLAFAFIADRKGVSMKKFRK
jgi:uncharacterized protein (DUF983 family)